MDNAMTLPSLILSFSLVLIALAINWKEKLELGKEIIVAVVRMIVQLIIAGLLLKYIFKLDTVYITVAVVIIMLLNAAWQASKRGKDIPHAFRISAIAIFISAFIALAILVLTSALEITPNQMIPVAGMLAGVCMNIVGLSFTNLRMAYRDKRQEVQEKLALGASVKQSSKAIIRESIKNSLQPTIDSTKTVGLVTLPGMMTGMIIAGVEPIMAIMYQIMIYFMMISSATICAVIVIYQTYPTFFDEQGRLLQTANQKEKAKEDED